MDKVRSLFDSDDVGSIVAFVGAVSVGLLVTCPSVAVVRLIAAVLATYAMTTWIVKNHMSNTNDARAYENAATKCYSRTSKRKPFATLMHPEATRAIASIATLSVPGRRASVKAVTRATESVIRAYHAALLVEKRDGHASACIDDMRDKTNAAVDALQTLRMEAGARGRAARVASRADASLRAFYARIRQIASNRLRDPVIASAPYAYDPMDDLHLVR